MRTRPVAALADLSSLHAIVQHMLLLWWIKGEAGIYWQCLDGLLSTSVARHEKKRGLLTVKVVVLFWSCFWQGLLH